MTKHIKTLLKPKNYISDRFHRTSSVRSYKYNEGNENFPESWVKINYKSYPRLDSISLPAPSSLKGSLKRALLNRRSRRDFGGGALSFDNLSTILRFGAGISTNNMASEDTALFY